MRIDHLAGDKIRVRLTALHAGRAAHDQSPRSNSTMRGTAGSSVPTSTAMMAAKAAVNR